MKDTKIINLYGGPGCGKSTGATHIFSELKLCGISCELVTEFAKDCVWDNSVDLLNDQLLVTAQQWHRVDRLLGKVDYIITDSPILIGLAYIAPRSYYSASLSELILNLHRSVKTMDVFIKRVKKYSMVGRIQTETEAKEKDVILKEIFEKHTNLSSQFYIIGDEDGYNAVIDEILLNHKGSHHRQQSIYEW